jgi:hypothetical protein
LPFAEGFEGITSFPSLLPEDGSRWHGYQLQPEGNEAQVVFDRAHSGGNSLRFYAAPYDGVSASKADLELGGLQFQKGDDVWFSGWYFLEEASDSKNLFLWDLEETRRWNSPGRRIYLSGGEALTSDLGKWWGGEVFRQPVDHTVPFPKGAWVEVVLHLYLSEGEDGLLEAWQDGALVLSGRGQTLPTKESIYDRMQVGITANGNEGQAQVLIVDDIVLSREPLR